MPMNRKTTILVSSLAAGTLAFGAAGAATAAISAEAPVRGVSAPPAPDPAAVRSEVNGLDAVSRTMAPLKAALAEHPDASRVRQLVEQAKESMDQLAQSSMGPHSAARPNDQLAQAVPQIKQRLDAVAQAAAAPNPDPGDLLNSVQGVVKGLIDLLSGLLQAVHTPSAPAQPAPGAPAMPATVSR